MYDGPLQNISHLKLNYRVFGFAMDCVEMCYLKANLKFKACILIFKIFDAYIIHIIDFYFSMFNIWAVYAKALIFH